ncbi:MAG: hypothetical protein AAF530_16150 [Pseudomonadota bacterium]
MPILPAINPGPVDWSGENPGILLKEDPDGPFSAMALFFRINYSPAGQGQALLLYEDPHKAAGPPTLQNAFYTDNVALAEHLRDTFIAKLAAFAEAPAFQGLQIAPLDRVETIGDPRDRYAEVVRAGDTQIELLWEDLGEPVALELPPSLTGPKDREMYTLLVESRRASISINGRKLKGEPAPRVQAGIETTTAFLYFAETWMWAQ